MPSLSNGQAHQRLSDRDLVVLYLARCRGQNMCEIRAKRIEDLLVFVRMDDREFAADIRGEDARCVRMFVEAYILGLNNATP